MSDRDQPPSGHDGTDAELRRDLIRLVAMSFSAGELSKYAERWRVFTDREGASQNGARALVRALSARGKLGELIVSLRAHKPLVQWPDPPPAPPEPTASEPSVAPPSSVTEDERTSEPPSSEPASVRSSGRDSDPDSGRQPLIDPYLSETDEPSPTKTHRPMMALVGIGGLLVGAGGMYLFHPDRAKARAKDRAPLAALARRELENRVKAVAEVCKVPSDGDSARDVLAVAFSECSVPELDRLRATASSSPRRAQPPSRRTRPGTKKSAASGADCLKGCAELYVSCAKSRCGPPPSSSADYDT